MPGSMKALFVVILFFTTLLFSPNSPAEFTPAYGGEFHQFEFQDRAYSIKITIYLSEAISWIDNVHMIVDSGENSVITQRTQFIESVVEYTDRLTDLPALAVYFKDRSLLEIAKDGSFLRFSPTPRSYQYRGEYTHRVRSPSEYHMRFPTAFESSPIWVVGTVGPTRRQPRYRQGWHPGELKLELIQAGRLKASCSTVFDLSEKL